MLEEQHNEHVEIRISPMLLFRDRFSLSFAKACSSLSGPEDSGYSLVSIPIFLYKYWDYRCLLQCLVYVASRDANSGSWLYSVCFIH